jgi:hypothetical protein
MADAAHHFQLASNQPCGALPLHTAEEDENRSADGKPRTMSHIDTNKRSTLYQEFKISIAQHGKTTTRIMELLLSNEIYKTTSALSRMLHRRLLIRGALSKSSFSSLMSQLFRDGGLMMC